MNVSPILNSKDHKFILQIFKIPGMPWDKNNYVLERLIYLPDKRIPLKELSPECKVKLFEILYLVGENTPEVFDSIVPYEGDLEFV